MHYRTLDDFKGEHGNCDLVVLCRSGNATKLPINIEAKADEPFGDTIGEYYDRKANFAYRTHLQEFGSYHWHCLDECLMKRFESFGISFCMLQPPH